MTDDLIQRLRGATSWNRSEVAMETAEEIERLREELAVGRVRGKAVLQRGSESESCTCRRDEMTTEWTDLPDLQAVAKAQAKGWEIEYRFSGSDWFEWKRMYWNASYCYRGRPAQPKIKVVTSECWRNKITGDVTWSVPASRFISEYQRVPKWDLKDGEVEE
jgi:hypothetical protein